LLNVRSHTEEVIGLNQKPVRISDGKHKRHRSSHCPRTGAEGVKVIVHGRDENGAAKVCEEIRGSGGEAAFACGDLKTDDGAAQVFRMAVEQFGRIDILINNAGVYVPHDWFQTTPYSWRESFEIDVLSAVRMS
jgi:3-oxoacyl-[acyl-carrier protein] reductase